MLIYVKGATLKAPESRLLDHLNQLRCHHAKLTIRTDPEHSQAKETTERWAKTRNIAVQHHGRPDFIIIQGLPWISQGQEEARVDDVIAQANLEWSAAAESGQEGLIQMGARWLQQLTENTKTILWLNDADDENTEAPLGQREPR